MRKKILTHSGEMLDIDQNYYSDVGKFSGDSEAKMLGRSGNILGKALTLGLLPLVWIEMLLA
jgi:hypothetical protein